MTEQAYGYDHDQAANDVPTLSDQAGLVEPSATVAPVSSAPVSVDPLAEMIGSINDSLEENNVTYRPEHLKGWALEFNVDIDDAEFKAFQKAATAASSSNRAGRRKAARGEGEPDMFNMCLAVIRSKSIGISFKGKDLQEDDGDEMTLNSAGFVELIKQVKGGEAVYSAEDAIRKFLGAPYILKLGQSITEEAGFSGEIEPVTDIRS